MDQWKITITRELNEEQKREAARLYADAFWLKLRHLWLFPSTREEAVEVIVHALDVSKGFYTLDDTGRLLGFVGLETGREYFVNLSWSSLRKVYGILSALWRLPAYWGFRLFHGGYPQEMLHIDAIVVSGEAQGMGIGTRLLEAVFLEAQNRSLKTTSLEVVDTNPKAKNLYERLGFRVVRQERYGVLTRKAGFGGVVFMEKSL
jgi:ribosomal protein S18 acetylase RimI-like enzyme